jgi:chorismate synthase
MNSFGNIFRISIWGESHGAGVGVTIDGCPPGVSIELNDFKKDLSRRKSGAQGTTPRIEADLPIIQSGVYKGRATGAPISIMVENTNIRSEDYELLPPRPGHADFVAIKKYKGFNDPRGGGHFSGRLTLCLVIAGVIAKKILKGVHICAKIAEIGGEASYQYVLEQAIKEGDSLGGIVECSVNNLPIGIGEPFFDSVESMIAHLAFSIPAIKGIEFGNGFESAKMKGSKHNDLILNSEGSTKSNNSGGINGGITNGNDLVFRVAVKPTSSIHKAQKSFDTQTGRVREWELKGRHDACIALRVPVVVEAITAIALVELSL